LKCNVICSGEEVSLDSETEYEVWMVAEDDGGHALPFDASAAHARPNLQAVATRVGHPGAPSVTTADLSPPSFVDRTPVVRSVVDDTCLDAGCDTAAAASAVTMVTVALSEPGRVWYVAVAMSDVVSSVAEVQVPTRAQVRSGFSATGAAGSAAGAIDVPTANTRTTHTLQGMGTLSRYADRYVLFVLAEDASGNEGEVRAVVPTVRVNGGEVH
jgi:hypothetical protein